ncbi:cytochrome-c oxidase [bacterium]|nr:cytochrome-c oxidase [bacterium]PJA76333.1 MAG: cytochrome-c oxidase [bacterium CG_4_9_14_3_um_filter_65_15]
MNQTTTLGGKAVVKAHLLPDGLFVLVWVGLLLLTAATVSASVFFPGKIGIGVALLVTPVKAALILLYFMHLKYEKVGFQVMFLAAVGILATFMGLTFFDYLQR